MDVHNFNLLRFTLRDDKLMANLFLIFHVSFRCFNQEMSFLFLQVPRNSQNHQPITQRIHLGQMTACQVVRKLLALLVVCTVAKVRNISPRQHFALDAFAFGGEPLHEDSQGRLLTLDRSRQYDNGGTCLCPDQFIAALEAVRKCQGNQFLL